MRTTGCQCPKGVGRRPWFVEDVRAKEAVWEHDGIVDE